ncbi:unnamed protein product [Mytilus coruscus]|uniref:Uncharacterized protein n=1 Tax=Mytilus coruscus TaxID=42192 RepID=A0A6J8AFE9_MYTCO|nr:unnamed protein product [Mytilus coruscus]
MKITRREKEGSDISSCTVVMSRKDEKSREIMIFCAVCSDYPKSSVLCKLVNMISTRVSMSNDAVTVVSGDGAKHCGLFCTFSNAVSSMTIDNNADIFQLARLLQLRRPEFFADFCIDTCCERKVLIDTSKFADIDRINEDFLLHKCPRRRVDIKLPLNPLEDEFHPGILNLDEVSQRSSSPDSSTEQCDGQNSSILDVIELSNTVPVNSEPETNSDIQVSSVSHNHAPYTL